MLVESRAWVSLRDVSGKNWCDNMMKRKGNIMASKSLGRLNGLRHPRWRYRKRSQDCGEKR